jgi:hypothetical protein
MVTDPLSVVPLVLLVPQGVVEVGVVDEDTLIEVAAARGDTHIGAGETCLRPF